VAVGERPRARPHDNPVSPLAGSTEQIASGLRAFAEAGAHEAILVVSPIVEDSIRELAGALAALDSPDAPDA